MSEADSLMYIDGEKANSLAACLLRPGSCQVSLREPKPQEAPTVKCCRSEHGKHRLRASFFSLFLLSHDNQFWDFHVNNPESVHALVHLFGSRGIPASVRRITGFGVHTFKLVAPDGSFKYCKFHLRPLQGVGSVTADEATRLSGLNPDFHTQELFSAIARGEYPSWGLYIQVMEPRYAEKYGLAMFDITKIWSHEDFPLIPVGKMTLNKNVSLYPDFICLVISSSIPV